MTLRVVMRPEASRDAEEERDYLESQKVGLGHVFVRRLRETLDRVGAMPDIYAIAARNVRAARLRQFAYVVYFRVCEDRAEVLAILHGSREVDAWKSRA